MAGRKPKPTQMKRLAGNPGKRALNDQEPQPPTADVRVPRGKLPREAKGLWRILAPMLADMGVLTAADLPALEFLCVHYAVGRAALFELEADGEGDVMAVSTASMQGIKKHPAASVLVENSRLFKSYLAEFGLTPSSRVKIKTPEPSEKSLAELLFAGVEND